MNAEIERTEKMSRLSADRIVTIAEKFLRLLYTPGGRVLVMLSLVLFGTVTRTAPLTNAASFALLVFLLRDPKRKSGLLVGALVALVRKKLTGT